MNPLKPQMTPAPFTADQPNEPDTGEHEGIATTGYVKRKQAETTAKVEESLADAVIAKARSLGALVLGAVALFFSVFLSLDARSQTKVDGGVAPVIADVASLTKRLDHVEVAVQQEALEHARQSVMLEMLTKERGMTPPPPAPKVLLPDGGQ